MLKKKVELFRHGRNPEKRVLRLPEEIVTDSAFPLDLAKPLIIKITPNSLVIENE